MPRRGKEKSWIFLFAVCRRKSQAIFDGRRGSFFLVLFFRLAFFSRVFSGHRSSIDARREPLFPPISGPFFLRKKGEFFPLPGPFSFRKRTGFPRTPKDFFPEPSMARFSHGIFDSGEKSRRKKRESGEISEEEKVSKSEENPFFSPSHFMAREKNLSHRWLGKKILPFFPIPIHVFFPSHSWLGEKHVNRKNGRPLRFQRNLRGPGVEKKGRISPDSEGVGGNIRKRTGFPRTRVFFSEIFPRNL